MHNFPSILLSLFINKYHYTICIYIYRLFTLILHSRLPVFPFIPYGINSKFVQRGFAERNAFEERVPALVDGCCTSTQVACSLRCPTELVHNSQGFNSNSYCTLVTYLYRYFSKVEQLITYTECGGKC